MNCPTCGTYIDPALFLAERQRELASRKRPASQGKPSRNPYGRGGKPEDGPKKARGLGLKAAR